MTRTLSFLLWVILAVVHLGQAQVGYNPKTNTLLCSKPGGHYCLEGPLRSPIMMSCLSNTDAEIRSCNIELSEILPGGYEETAVCYESSPSAGDAVCAFNGTGYAFDGSRVKLDETVLCDVPVHLLSKRDSSHQEDHATPTTTITVTVWDRIHTQVETQISPIDATTSAYSSSWPENGYTTTVLSDSSSFSITEFETSPVDSTTPICSNPWPENGHIATAVTVMPGDPSPIPSASSTESEAEDIDNEETMPAFQPHIFVETSIETESRDDSLYPTIIMAIVTEAQTETDSSTMPIDELPLEDEFEPLIFEHSESESERPWMIVSEAESFTTQSGVEFTETVLLLTNKPTLARGMVTETRTTTVFADPAATQAIFTSSGSESERPWIIIDEVESVITSLGQELTGTILLLGNEPTAATTAHATIQTKALPLVSYSLPDPKSGEDPWVTFSQIESVVTHSGRAMTFTDLVPIGSTTRTASREEEIGISTRSGKLVLSSVSETWTGVNLDRPSQTMGATATGGANVLGLNASRLMLLWLMGMAWSLVVGV